MLTLEYISLRGNCELLNILYQAGMGARRSEGHGKFEILL
ncbi:MAG: CRISPR-associated endoribonuclease Cas6 [Lachnospira eligens]